MIIVQFYLSCIPGHVSSEVESASAMLTRPLSGGSQIYQNSNKTPPVGQSINKLEGLVQVCNIALQRPHELALKFDCLTTKKTTLFASRHYF